jgi:hypothetical protein
MWLPLRSWWGISGDGWVRSNLIKKRPILNLVKGEENFCEEAVKYPSLSLAAAYSILMCNCLTEIKSQQNKTPTRFVSTIVRSSHENNHNGLSRTITAIKRAIPESPCLHFSCHIYINSIQYTPLSSRVSPSPVSHKVDNPSTQRFPESPLIFNWYLSICFYKVRFGILKIKPDDIRDQSLRLTGKTPIHNLNT